MKKKVIYGSLLLIGAFIISGCTASSSPGVNNFKRYNPNFIVDSNDRVNVSVTKDSNVTIQKYEQDRIAQKIEAKINELNTLNQKLAQQAAAAGNAGGEASGGSAKKDDDDVIDAEVE